MAATNRGKGNGVTLVPSWLHYCQLHFEKKSHRSLLWSSCFWRRQGRMGRRFSAQFNGFLLVQFLIRHSRLGFLSRMASKGRRNPVCKSHHRDFVTIRGLFTLFYYHCLILLTRQCSAVYRWCNSAVKKRRKKGGKKHKNMLFKPPSCTPGASVQKGKKTKRKTEMHFTSHVWRLTHYRHNMTASYQQRRKQCAS